jgi:hypothetical protein
MKTALEQGDVEGAVGAFNEGSREKYRNTFTRLQQRLPELAAGMGPIELVYAKGEIAKHRITREQEFQGQTVAVTYYIYFSRNRDGIWQIEEF